MTEEISKKIQELQSIEQNLQMFLQQKQTIQFELNEISNALNELKNSKEEESYKISSGIMIKTPKIKLVKELEEKQKVLESRVSSIEKQEALLESKISELREYITKNLPDNSKRKNSKDDD